MGMVREDENRVLAAVNEGAHLRVIHDGLVEVMHKSFVTGLETLAALEREGLIVRNLPQEGQFARKEHNRHSYRVVSPNANARLSEHDEWARKEFDNRARISAAEREALREEGRQEVRAQLELALLRTQTGGAV